MRFLATLLSTLLLVSGINACVQVYGRYNGYSKTLEYFTFYQDGALKCELSNKQLQVGNNWLGCQVSILWLSGDRETVTWLSVDGGKLTRYYLPLELYKSYNGAGQAIDTMIGRFFSGCGEAVSCVLNRRRNRMLMLRVANWSANQGRKPSVGQHNCYATFAE